VLNCSVSSWDKNDDLIRFRIDWGDGSESEFSAYVASNESVIFSHQYETSGEYDIRVSAQDEQGLNSSWSQSYSFLVQGTAEPDLVNEHGIVASVNNETGEIYFDFELTNDSTNSTQIVWDFGDGVVLEGSSPTHQYAQPGNYTVTVTITDEDGKVTMKTYTVCVPEPQKEIDTAMMTSTESVNSVPWVFVLVGIVLSFLGVVAVLKFR
jgi:PKD repeat protein